MQTTTTIVALCAGTACGQLSFVDATADLGLADLAGPHCCFVDLNNDARPDAVVGRNRVFLNVSDADAPRGLRFVEVGSSGLPAFRTGDIAVFADLDNDGNKDCLWTRYLDINADNYEPPTDGPPKSAWLKGNGDGTFGKPLGAWEVIDAAQEATTAAVAVGDVDRDGALDVYLGNWYVKYGDGLEGYPNQLISGFDAPDDRAPWDQPRLLPDQSKVFDEEHDAAGRPTYGVMIVHLDPSPLPLGAREGTYIWGQLLDLNYGRRWNRLLYTTRPIDEHPRRMYRPEFHDLAPSLGLDGDDIRHGRYPEWLKERAKADPRFDREDELPFRANGNTFDAAVGDIENDGDFDLFLAEITHAWAGESSDRSRFLVQEREPRPQHRDRVRFVSKPELSVDRAPTDPTIQSWNQGDIYAELADFDLDGRLDLLLCSSDYPDNQRLRIYRQQPDGSFCDITSWVGIDHIGAGQPSLADIDADGDLDIMVGQSFNRLRADQTTGREPRVRVYLNQAADKALGKAITLRLVGDPTPRDADRPEDRLTAASRDALGAIVRMTAVIHGERVTQSRQLIGIGGHQGKQMDFALHFGLGDAAEAERIEIEWPSVAHQVTVLEHVEPGTHTVHLADEAAGD